MSLAISSSSSSSSASSSSRRRVKIVLMPSVSRAELRDSPARSRPNQPRALLGGAGAGCRSRSAALRRPAPGPVEPADGSSAAAVRRRRRRSAAGDRIGVRRGFVRHVASPEPHAGTPIRCRRRPRQTASAGPTRPRRAVEPDGGIAVGPAAAGPLDQHIAFAADPRAELGRQRAPRRPRAAAPPARGPAPGATAGIRAAGVPGRGLYGKTCRKAMPHSSTMSRLRRNIVLVLGREAGDQIGADRDLGPQGAGAPRRGDRLGAASGGASCASGSGRRRPAATDADAASAAPRRRAAPTDRRRSRSDRARTAAAAAVPAPPRAAAAPSAPRLGRARQVGAVGGQVDPGQHDLAAPGRDQSPRLLDDRADRHRPARPARVGDDAEGAAMVAALLHLQIGAGAGVPSPVPRSPRAPSPASGRGFGSLSPLAGRGIGVRRLSRRRSSRPAASRRCRAPRSTSGSAA